MRSQIGIFIITILGALFLFVGLNFLPTHPDSTGSVELDHSHSEEAKKPELPTALLEKLEAEIRSELDSLNTLEEKVILALKYKKEGPMPMKGVFMMREIARLDSSSAIPPYLLGEFSMETGQLEKAIGHYNSAIKIDDTFDKAYFSLSMAYAQVNDFDNAIKSLKDLQDKTNDSNLAAQIEVAIKELEKYK